MRAFVITLGTVTYILEQMKCKLLLLPSFNVLLKSDFSSVLLEQALLFPRSHLRSAKAALLITEFKSQINLRQVNTPSQRKKELII